MNKKVKLTALAVALSLSFTACSTNTNDTTEEPVKKVEESVEETKDQAADSKDKQATKPNEDTDEAKEDAEDSSDEKAENEDNQVGEKAEDGLVLRRSLQAPHGEGSFARIAVITNADKIVDVAIDELQYFDEDSEFEALPNQDEETAFKKGNAEGKILGSKVINSDPYSKLMEENAGATKTLADNYKAIQDFAKGKTIGELEEILSGAKDGEPIDAISEATLVDSKGYLEAIVNTAKEKSFVTVFEANDNSDLLLKQFFGTAGADNAVTDTFVVLEDGVIVAANIDEYQYIGENGVPNSDSKLAENFENQDKKLSSKLENNEEYSKLMKDKAGATKNLAENFKAIENFVVGKTPEEIKEIIDANENGKPVDAVSEATLNNTVGYLEEIYKAATN